MNIEELMAKVTDELVKLQGQRQVLVEALLPIAKAYSDDPGTWDLYNEQPVGITLGDVRRARSALGDIYRKTKG